MLELYNHATSTCSQKARIVLAEKGLEWEDRRIDIGKGEHLTPEYLALNPNGVVPTLVHDGHGIIDSSVIIEHLDELFPQTRLSPEDPVERAHMRTWLRNFEEVPTKFVRYPSHNLFLVKMFKDLDADEIRKRAEVRPLRKHFYLKRGRTGFGEAHMAEAMIGSRPDCRANGKGACRWPVLDHGRFFHPGRGVRRPHHRPARGSGILCPLGNGPPACDRMVRPLLRPGPPIRRPITWDRGFPTSIRNCAAPAKRPCGLSRDIKPANRPRGVRPSRVGGA